jgi:Tol biopolymer transport system component
MQGIAKATGTIALTVLGAAAGVLLQPATGAAAASGATTTSGATGGSSATGAGTLPSLVAYVRGGNVYVSRGAAEVRLTRDGGYSRPRWSPDGRQIAFLRGGQLWTMKADGTAKRRLTTRAASGPSWSPDGRFLAFASLSCSGGPGVYRISATAVGATPQVLFPAGCRGEALPPEPPLTVTESGGLNERLRADNTVAWSPDGSRVAFRGGDCESTYDACLSVGTVTTGGERTMAAYGGGGRQNSGFAAIPNWRSDGAKLAWTAYQQGETPTDDEPVHLVEYDMVNGAMRTVGGALDREMAYVDATRAVVTGPYRGGSWIVVVNLTTGARTPLHAGSQPSVQPVR